MRLKTTAARIAALAAAAALAAIVASAGNGRPAAAAPPAAAHRWKIVFVVSDDENIYGSAVMHDVKHLIADHGVTFTDFHVTTSECGPSRASILTGQYPHHTGVTGNFGPHGYPSFNEHEDLAVWLHDAGYSTALVGKYINDYSLDGHNRVPPDWTDWQAMDSVPLEKYYDYTVNENGKLVHYGTAPSDYSTTVLTGKALDFLHHTRRPFFLYFAPVTPHLPAVPAPQDVGRFDSLAPFKSPSLNQANISDEPWAAWHERALTADGLSYVNEVRRRQLESLQSVDRAVAKIVAVLKQRHELDRTVIFYTSDNGFLWGEHRLGGKLWPYTQSINVPLVVRTPWTAGNGTTSSKPVLNVDFASTISQLAGVTPGIPQDGQSFVPLLHGKKIPWRNEFLVEYLGKNKLHDGGPPPYIALRTPDYLYVHYRFRNWQELYNLKTDPFELRNVAADPAYAATLKALQAELHRLYEEPPHRVPA
jgi:arylsulfatase A-like enzyme